MTVRSAPIPPPADVLAARGAAIGVVLIALGLLFSGALPGMHPQQVSAASTPTPGLVAPTERPAVIIIATAQPAARTDAGPAGAVPAQPDPPARQDAPPAADSAPELAQPTYSQPAAPPALPAGVPAGAELYQGPGGSYYQAAGSQLRYDIDAAGNVVSVRLPGADVAQASDTPPEQKVFLDPSNPADAAYLAQAAEAAPQPVARPCAARQGCARLPKP